jgi:acetolactate synthase-1/2/3 large subunit
MEMPATPITLADAMIGELKARGVERMFGVPGSGSSLDLITAADKVGLDFILCRSETAAAISAAVTAELGGAPGVVLAGIGPGAASLVNGVAYAGLERAPLIVLTDARPTAPRQGPGNFLHQVFDQQAMFAPLAKATMQIKAEGGLDSFRAIIDQALAYPPGPVHIDLSVQAAGEIVSAGAHVQRAAAPTGVSGLDDAAAILRSARRPVALVGLEARSGAAADALRALTEAITLPVLTTYKAKGVMAEDHALFVGPFTGATNEARTLNQADVILCFGVDSIEMILSPWPYTAKIIALNEGPARPQPTEPAALVQGPIAKALIELSRRLADHASDWTLDEIAGLRDGMRRRAAMAPSAGLTAHAVVEATLEHAPAGARATVDAGAHMFSAMALWPARNPHDVLKSNGLSTMGFALPAAIASSLAEPGRPVVAFIGDGGLMMCLGEISTAARLNCDLVVIVLNDAALALIGVKQEMQQRPRSGVNYPALDFAAIARGMGCKAWRAEGPAGLSDALAEAFNAANSAGGPRLIDARIDPSGYGDQLAALRG